MDKIDIRDLIVRTLRENQFFTLDYKDDDIKCVESKDFLKIAESIVENLPIYVIMKQRDMLIDFCNKAEDNAKAYEHLIPSDDFIDKYLKDKA